MIRPVERRRRALVREIALIAFFATCYAVLGQTVSGQPPGTFDRGYEAFVGQATPLAALFTRSCLLYVLGPLALVALAFGVRVPTWRARAFGSVALTLVMWVISDRAKDAFQRPRPEHWVWHHESSFAYSSGHAMFALIVYGLWAWYAYRSTLPRAARIAIALALMLWACGIIWSRLALGAHYPTDLIGGLLLGATGITALHAAATVIGMRS